MMKAMKTDDNGCPIPCPGCGSCTVLDAMGTRIVMHNPGCTKEEDKPTDASD